jgi:anthranilate phosphoribosyltransferase
MIDPSDVGLPYARLSDLQADSPKESANTILLMLQGKPGAARDIAVLNAGAALVVAGKTDELRDGVAAAEDALDSGKAAETLAAWVRCSHL